MNLNKLNYPLFKITLDEAWLLTEARKKLHHKPYVCVALDYVEKAYPCEEKACERLREKIGQSIRCHSFLSGHLSNRLPLGQEWHAITDWSNQKKLRQIWIKKLLQHNGYL